MKTLNEIKIEVAKINGCDSWAELLTVFHKGDHEEFYDHVAIEYANSKLQLAADNLEWDNCYDGGAHCARERHEKSIESLKDII